LYRRVYHDLARFIKHLPQPDKFNFVFDPRAASGDKLPSANPLPQYPENDDKGTVQPFYTARRWDLDDIE
jgi:hypothetical protein